MNLNRRFFWAYLLPKQFIVNCAKLGSFPAKFRMPGTVGSFFGFLFYAIFFHHLTPFYYICFLLLCTYLAMGICDAAEFHLMQKDPSIIVLDEFVAVPFIFIGMNGANGLASQFGGWPVFLAGFVLFRIIDIVKPFGITHIEKLEGGIACVLDDIVAALLVSIILHLILLQI